MDISQTRLIQAARQSAKDAHDKPSISPRHINNLVKHIFDLCDAYEQLESSYAGLQRRIKTADGPECLCPKDGMPFFACPIHGAAATGRGLR